MSPDFRLEEHPLVLMKPHIAAPYAWVGHIPFGYLAVDLLRPRILVELGTHSGNSYFAFCQAAHALNLSCRFTAVDAWQGDAHALHYGEEIYQALRARHDPAYGDFSQLLRCFFDEALVQFDDGSIDLLHIDGLHTYEAVRHDFESWLPKLSDRSVVLLHDTEVRERGFGVGQFFDELKERFPCFSFLHSHGLGIVVVGANVPAAFAAFMHAAEKSPEAIRGFFEGLAGTLVDTDDRPMPAAVTAPLPVTCHLFYRRQDEIFDESRMISQPINAADSLVDIHFQLPAGMRPDYLRLDPADLPGVFGLSQVMLHQENHDAWIHLDHLADRLGHVGGELLPTPSTHSVRVVSFDDDPYVEFEIASALLKWPEKALQEVTIRVEYEVVLQDPALHRVMEKQAVSLTDMRELSHQRMNTANLLRRYSVQVERTQQLANEISSQRIDIENLANESSARRTDMRQLANEISSQRIDIENLTNESSARRTDMRQLTNEISSQRIDIRQLASEYPSQMTEMQKLVSECSNQRSEMQRLALELDRSHAAAEAGIQRLEAAISRLPKHNFWSVLRRITGRVRP